MQWTIILAFVFDRRDLGKSLKGLYMETYTCYDLSISSLNCSFNAAKAGSKPGCEMQRKGLQRKVEGIGS